MQRLKIKKVIENGTKAPVCPGRSYRDYLMVSAACKINGPAKSSPKNKHMKSALNVSARKDAVFVVKPLIIPHHPPGCKNLRKN